MAFLVHSIQGGKARSTLEMMKSGKRKIILVGAEGFAGETESTSLICVPWDRLRLETNLRDFDVIILNLLDLNPIALPGAFNPATFSKVINFPIACDVLDNGGTIIVIGDPRFELGAEPSAECGLETARLPFLFWTGLRFAWDSSKGFSISKGDGYNYRFHEEYLRRLDKWDYSLERCVVNPEILRTRFDLSQIEDKGLKIDVWMTRIAQNRYNHLLIFEARVRVFEDFGRNEVRHVSGPMIFLPPISATTEETLRIVLRDICGFEAAVPEPKWISIIKAPNQEQIDREIEKIETELTATRDRLNLALEERLMRRDCLKLLYERELELEPAVRDILRKLGATVTDPKEPNKEDGWINITVRGTTYEGVLEIKSTSKDHFDEGGIRQLVEWIQRGISREHKKFTGVFIGNSAVHLPPEERKDPFPDNWKKSAELNGICAIRSSDLYEIYVLHSRGAIDLDEFWTTLFNCKGVFPVERFRKSGTN